MSGRSVIHDTFAIERSYLAIPSRVFAAFASTEAKSNWRWIDRLAEDDGAVGAEFDFRIGGRERFGFPMDCPEGMPADRQSPRR
jgi:uncharacterized protein YndB with AHSA1/START domain